jgi:vesicle coat complex subunit
VLYLNSQAIESKDVVIKKMVYLYLCTYANSQPELAIMCINSLRREWYDVFFLKVVELFVLV